MTDEEDLKPLLVEIRDIVLRHEEVNRRDAEFRKRVLFALLFALAIAVGAMGYALMLVHATTKEIRQRQEQQQPPRVANLSTLRAQY
jgi:CHASE3 domain sensor protein